MSEHTPGPWTMAPNGLIRSEARIERKTLGVFQGIASDDKHALEHTANCDLIAAAPEIYEALKALVAVVREYAGPGVGVMAEDEARAVLAKAEGRTP